MKENNSCGNAKRKKQQIMAERAFPVPVQKRPDSSSGAAAGTIVTSAFIEKAEHSAMPIIDIGKSENADQWKNDQKRSTLPEFQGYGHTVNLCPLIVFCMKPFYHDNRYCQEDTAGVFSGKIFLFFCRTGVNRSELEYRKTVQYWWPQKVLTQTNRRRAGGRDIKATLSEVNR